MKKNLIKYLLILFIITLIIITLITLNVTVFIPTRNKIIEKVVEVNLLTNSSVILTGSPENPYSSSNVGNVGLNTDLWNLASNSKGSVTMILRNSVLYVNVNFSLARYLNSPTVLGYPEILYGVNVWGGGIPAPSPLLPLPISLYNITNVQLLVNYSIRDTNTPIDFAYDIWIVKNVTTSGATHGDIEMMIWLYHTNDIVPAGNYITSINLPIFINGSEVNANWNIYVYNGSGDSWTIITFELNNPISAGSVSLNLGNFITELTHVLSTFLNWNENYMLNLKMETIDLGSEFRQNPFGGAIYSYTIYAYKIEIINNVIENTSLNEILTQYLYNIVIIVILSKS